MSVLRKPVPILISLLAAAACAPESGPPPDAADRVFSNPVIAGFSRDGEEWSVLGEGVDGVRLSPAVIEGYNYTGAYVGLYASSNGAATDNHADFQFFRYRPMGESRDHWYHRQENRAAGE